MDESVMLMLSNLLHLHNHLDPTTSLLSDLTSSSSSSDATSPTTLLTSTSAAPLLFFTIASVLSYIASHPSKPKPPSKTPTASASALPPSSGEFSVAAFRALSTEHIWAMEVPLRDAQWRSLYGLSYPVFTTVVEKLKPYITQSQLSLPSDYAVAMVLSRLCHGLSAKTLASNSDNVCFHLEEKSGGVIIYRHINVLLLYRGRNYDPKNRPVVPLMMWKPLTPIYLKLVKPVADGLSFEETKEMRNKGLNSDPVMKLTRNGVYVNVVERVRDAFETKEVVRLDCSHVGTSDCKKISVKLKDLVPCVPILFKDEQVILWKGKNYLKESSQITEHVA